VKNRVIVESALFSLCFDRILSANRDKINRERPESMKSFTVVIVLVLMLAVLGAMGFGLWQMAHEGDDRRKKSNKMMQLRIYLQGAVLALLALMAALTALAD